VSAKFLLYPRFYSNSRVTSLVSLAVSGVLLGGGINRLPGRNFARFILMQFILFSLVIRTGYQGVQFEMMLTVCRFIWAITCLNNCYNSQDMRPKDVGTIDELLAKNYTIYVDPFFRIVFGEVEFNKKY
jgi:hypothetical protein